MFGLGCLVSVGMRNGSVKRSRGGLEPINQAKLGGLAWLSWLSPYLQNAEAAPGTRTAQGGTVAVPGLPQLQAMKWLMPISLSLRQIMWILDTV